MRIPLSMALVLVIVSVDSTKALAQQAELAKGTRVRLITSSLQPDHQLARIVSADKDSIVFRSDTYPVSRTLAVTDIERIDISGGIHRQTARGTLMGLMIGGVGGVALGLATYSPCTGWLCIGPTTRGGSAMLGGGVLGVIGGVIGAVVGANHDREEWKPLVVQPVSAKTAGGQRTFGVALSRTF